MRERFERKLNELRDDVLKMGSMVEEEITLALQALDTLDVSLVPQIFEADVGVNKQRFAIEEKCFALIVTQQPAASDLRRIIGIMNMIVDLERMGDKAKSIGKIVPRLVEHPKRARVPEIQQLG
ncbi:MAG: phosphate transport system regulatory protein PhoU, partial [Chloroflexi bacterium]